MNLTDIGWPKKIVLPSVVILGIKTTMMQQCWPCAKHLY